MTGQVPAGRHVVMGLGGVDSSWASVEERIADIVQEFLHPDVKTLYVQTAQPGAVEIIFTYYKIGSGQQEHVPDLRYVSPRDLLWMSGTYADFARAAAIGEIPRGVADDGLWAVPYGLSATEYTAIAGALCAAAIEKMSR